jgi:hypothetical protein
MQNLIFIEGAQINRQKGTLTKSTQIYILAFLVSCMGFTWFLSSGQPKNVFTIAIAYSPVIVVAGWLFVTGGKNYVWVVLIPAVIFLLLLIDSYYYQ